MKALFTPTLRLSIALLSLTISLIFIAFSFGLVPNEDKAALEARARISEHLAVQLANLISRNDITALRDTITSIIGRKTDVLSIGIRGADDKLLVGSKDHGTYWHDAANGKSTATHVQIPLLNAEVPRGRIEIAFRPLASGGNILGFSQVLISFIGFIGVAGFGGYYFILRRALRELDPGQAIPERVKAAFDTLAEGVLIMDERKFVLLANDAFVENIYCSSDSLLGMNVEELPWIHSGRAAAPLEFPWQTVLHDRRSVLGIAMGIRDHAGQPRELVVNATQITDAKGNVRGVIATFNDVTVLQQTNEKLNRLVDQLNFSQTRIAEQNQELQILASIDPLTGCFNRRAFFDRAEGMLQSARAQRQPMSFLMVDMDHFKKINDRFGHMMGDKTLVGLVDLLKRALTNQSLIGRYGGEEFCIAMAGYRDSDVAKIADRIRQSVADTKTWLPGAEPVTVSIGIASVTDDSCKIADLVKRADEALYVAKKAGRNRIVNWHKMPVLEEVQLKTALPQAATDETASISDSDPAREHVQAIIREDHGGRCFAMALIALEGFSDFIAGYGRSGGDALMFKIGERIARRLRAGDMLARLGNDGFYLLLDPFENKEQVRPMLDRLLDEFSRPFFIEGVEVLGAISLGVSVYPEHGRDYDVLRKNAETAAHHAKRNARGGLMFFDSSMTQAAARRVEAEQRLRLAVRDREFCCAFQPKVDISSQKVVGFEALARWRGDNGEVQSPGEFIKLAVELDLIDQITDQVLETVIKSFDQLDAAYGSHITVSLNIAAKQANDLEFMNSLVRTLRDSNRAHRIILELTEDSFIAKGAFQTKIIPSLREIGVRVSIDDFGTGYSSLSALADITADEIKIDRSFISGIHQRPRNQSVLRAINSLGDALGMIVVAEGVETYEELVYLQAATSIRYVQGFYFSKPFYLEAPVDASALVPVNRHPESSRVRSVSRPR